MPTHDTQALGVCKQVDDFKQLVAQTIGELTQLVPQNIGADAEHRIAVVALLQPQTLKTSEEPSQITNPSLE
jgi:hypothetical protein